MNKFHFPLTMLMAGYSSSANFSNVMLANSPVSDGVRSVLYDRLSEMPDGISNAIRAAQLNGSIRTPEAIRREIESARIQRLEADREAIEYYLEMESTDASAFDSALTILEGQHTVEADQAVVATLIARGYLDKAEAKLASMLPGSAEEQQFIAMQSMLLDLGKDSLDVHQMNADQLALVTTIANDPVSSRARTNARAILFWLFNQTFDEFSTASARSQASASPSVSDISKFMPEHKYLGKNYPNPFSNETVIPYYLPEGTSGSIEITDVTGKLLASYPAISGSNKLQLDSQKWEPGVYFYSIIVGNSKLEHYKMVLMK